MIASLNLNEFLKIMGVHMAITTDLSIKYYDHWMSSLASSSQAFKNYDKEKGFKEFRLVYPTFQNKVYEQLWIKRGSPQGILDYGKHSFHDQFGHSSTLIEKAGAIDSFFAAEKTRKAGIAQRLAVNDGGYVYDYGRRQYRWDPMHRTPNDMFRDQEKFKEVTDPLLNNDDPDIAIKRGIFFAGFIGAIVFVLATTRH